MKFPVHLNTTRSGLDNLAPQCRLAEARRAVKMFVLPRRPEGMMLDSMVPDILVTDDMVDRFLQLEPPIALVIPEFQQIIEEIEYAYVVGVFFAATSAACVTIERVLNLARIKLHSYQPKIKELWDKGPSNSWSENIRALQSWHYLDETFASELESLYTDVRCRYLHSGPITDLPGDALKVARAAYKILSIFLGFPPDLFRLTSRIECLNTQDPRFLAFYKPHVQDESVDADTVGNGSLTSG